MSKYSVSLSSADYWRKVGPFMFAVNTPEAVTGEGVRGLPPHHGRKVFLVDKYPACPKHWMRSEGRVTGFWFPFIMNNGLWLDFNGCARSTEYDVAVVISVQGVNAITGMPCTDAKLEQYYDKCPVCSESFGPERFCAGCGFKWPKQNYLSLTSCSNGAFWIDGFRDGNGRVRQYVMTPDIAKGVANAIIGKAAVPAIGLSFFLSRTHRVKPKLVRPDVYLKLGAQSVGYDYDFGGDSKALSFDSGSKGARSFGGSLTMLCSTEPDTARYGRIHCTQSAKVKAAHVGRGAEINQTVNDDSNGLDYWQEQPESIALLNYCTDDEADAIIAGGEVDVSGSGEGFMSKIPIAV